VNKPFQSTDSLRHGMIARPSKSGHVPSLNTMT